MPRTPTNPSIDEMVCRVDLLDVKEAVDHWKARGLDFSNIFYKPRVSARIATHQVRSQDHGLERALDHKLIELCQAALNHQIPVQLDLPIRNTQRTVGTMLSGEVARRYGSEGLPEDTIQIKFTGSAGQSFGAFLAKGISLTLEGDANDYLGKGISGGRLVVYPPRDATFVPEENILVGSERYGEKQERAADDHDDEPRYGPRLQAPNNFRHRHLPHGPTKEAQVEHHRHAEEET